MRALLALAAVLYFAAYLLSTRWRTYADRELHVQVRPRRRRFVTDE